MIKTFTTPSGKEIREATPEELNAFMTGGDNEAKKEVLKTELGKAISLQQELDAIKKYLGV